MNWLAERVPVAKRGDAGIYVLLVVGWMAAFCAGTIFHRGVYVRTVTRTLTPSAAVSRMSARQIVAALGKPDQEQAQANGITCAVWVGRGIEICWR